MDDCLGVGTMEVGSGPVGAETCPAAPGGPDIILTQGARRKLTERGIRWANAPDGRSDLVVHGGPRVNHINAVMNVRDVNPSVVGSGYRKPGSAGNGGAGSGGAGSGGYSGAIKYRFGSYGPGGSSLPNGRRYRQGGRVPTSVGGAPDGRGVDGFGNEGYPWTPVTPVEPPGPPPGPMCPVWLPTAARVFCFGGYSNQVVPFEDFIPFYGTNMAEIYDPEMDSWEEVAHPPVQADRTGPEMVLLNSGKVLIMSGHAMNSGSTFTSVELFDPTTETFTLVPTPSDGQSSYAMQGPVLLSGSTTHGKVLTSRGPGSARRLYVYDPDSGPVGSFTISSYDPVGGYRWSPSPNFGTNSIFDTTGIQLITGSYASWVFYHDRFSGRVVLYNPLIDSGSELDTSGWNAGPIRGNAVQLHNGNLVFNQCIVKTTELDLPDPTYDFDFNPDFPPGTSNVENNPPAPWQLPSDKVFFPQTVGNNDYRYDLGVPAIWDSHLSCADGVFNTPDVSGTWTNGLNSPNGGSGSEQGEGADPGVGTQFTPTIQLGNRDILWAGGFADLTHFSDPLNGSISRKASVYSETDGVYVVVSDMNYQRVDHAMTLLPYTTPIPHGHKKDLNTVGLWRFDEAGGSDALVDIKGNRNINAFGDPDVGTGQIGGARQISGPNTQGGATKFFQKQGDGTFGRIFNGAWSVEMWIKPESHTGGRVLFMYNGLAFSFNNEDTILGEFLYYGSGATGKIAFQTWQNTTSGLERQSSGTMTANAWHHVAHTREPQGGNLFLHKLYIDGQLDSSHPGMPGMDYVITGSNHFIGIGNYTDILGYGTGSAPFNGLIDDTRFSSGTRSGVDILESYNRGSAIRGPKHGPWVGGLTLPYKFIAPAISRLSNGDLIVTGGDDDERPGHPGVFNAGYAFKIDKSGISTTVLPTMQSSRSYHSQLTYADDSLFVIGGGQSVGIDPIHYAEVFKTGSWHETSMVPTLTGSSDFYDAAVALLRDQRVAVVGGVNTPRDVVRSIHHLYHSGTNLWTSMGAPEVLRQAATLHTLPDGRLLMVGGVSVPNDATTVVTSSEIWNSGSGLWTTIPGPAGIYQHMGLTLNDGKILIFGGRDIADNQITATYLYTPNAGTGSWLQVGNMPDPLDTYESPTKNAVVLDDGRVVTVMGADTSAIPEHGNKVNVYNPTTQTWTGWDRLPGGSYGYGVLGKLSRNRVIHLGADLDATYTYTSGSRILAL